MKAPCRKHNVTDASCDGTALSYQKKKNIGVAIPLKALS